MRPRLPKQIKIGAHMTSVRRVKQLQHGDQPLYGDCNLGRLEICVSEDQPPSIEAETLLHEIFHAIFELNGLTNLLRREDDEEQFVQSMAHSVTQVLLDNLSLRRMFELFPSAGEKGNGKAKKEPKS